MDDGYHQFLLEQEGKLLEAPEPDYTKKRLVFNAVKWLLEECDKYFSQHGKVYYSQMSAQRFHVQVLVKCNTILAQIANERLEDCNHLNFLENEEAAILIDDGEFYFMITKVLVQSLHDFIPIALLPAWKPNRLIGHFL